MSREQFMMCVLDVLLALAAAFVVASIVLVSKQYAAHAAILGVAGMIIAGMGAAGRYAENRKTGPRKGVCPD